MNKEQLELKLKLCKKNKAKLNQHLDDIEKELKELKEALKVLKDV